MGNVGSFVCTVCKVTKPSFKSYKGSSPKVCKLCVQTALRQPYTPHQNARYSQVKGSAVRRGILFLLTKDQFIAFGELQCFYCGSPNDNYGVDRFDNTKGYTNENCRSCCPVCNTAKLAMTADDFLKHCEKVVNFQQK